MHKPRLSSGSAKRPLIAYGFAVVISLLMLAIRSSFQPLLSERAPFSFFLISVMVAACHGGLGPGLLALALGLILGDFFFLPPYHQLGLGYATDWVLMLGYVIPALLAILLFEALHTTRRRLELTSRRLKEELQEHQRTERALREAEASLRSHSLMLEETVQKRTSQLEETIDSLETFSYTIAHNLRAPLRALNGLSQAVIEDHGQSLSPQGQDYLLRIRDSAVRMDALICDLLGYNKARADRESAHAVPLLEVVRQALQSLQAQVASSRAVISVAPELPSVMASEPPLLQAITILLSNALKFVPPGEPPRIEITSSTHEGTVRLFIRDHGIGIDPAYHQRIFGIFERLHEKEYPGNGIGLPIARLAVERLGGAIGLSSAPGEGSTFWMDLPAVQPVSPPETPPPVTVSAP